MNQRIERSPQQGGVGLDDGLSALRESPEFRGPVEPPDDHGHSNDHLALVYESVEEQFAAAVPFVRQGLERGERCLYVADESTREDVLAAMRDGGIDVDAALESGALSVHSPSDTYRRSGEFDRDAMLEFWEDALVEATEEREYTGIRAAAEMTWALDGDMDLDRLVEYEAMLNPLYRDDDYVVLCQYNRERFPAEVIHGVIKTHPYLVHEDTVSHNVYYTPPEKFFGSEEPEEKVDRMLWTLRDQTETKTERQEHTQFLHELYETTANGDRSFERTVEKLLELGRERFDLEGGALTHLPSSDGKFRAEVTVGSEMPDRAGVLPVQPDEGCFSRLAITRDEPTAVPDVAEVGWDDTDVFRELGLASYFGISVTAGTEPYGTLWFYDTSPREEPFTDDERTFLELMGQWVSYELEQRRREAELRQSKEYFERIFENSNDAIFLVDPGTEELIDVNQAASEMLGYSRDELLSLTPADLHPDEMSEFRAFVDEVLTEGSAWTEGLHCRTSDGQVIPAEISASTIDSVDGPLVLAAVRGYEERQKRERALRRLYRIAADPDRPFDEKLDAVFDLGCELFDVEFGGMARVDVDADVFEVEVMNAEHDHLVPGERYPLSETYCRAATEDRDIAAIVDPISEGFEGKLCYDKLGVRTYLGTHLELDGDDDRTLFFLSNERRQEPFSEAERTFHHLMGQWVKHELQRQRYEQDLEEMVEQLRQSNDRLKQFAFAASHDLQEPLRMVSSYLHLLEDQYGDELDEEAREYIDFAIGGADRMRAMVDDLLAYSRVEQSDGSFDPVDCNAILDRVTTDLQVQIEDNEAEIAVGSLPTVMADGEQLEQLFGNLVSNAIKYNDADSPRVEITAEEHPDHWEFSVADDGIGIDPDKTDRIFEVFKRLHHDDEYSGTGIGLSLCQEIVENHGGDIRVDSEPGAGSTFFVTLPKRTTE